jgi:hypothetical protein
MVTVTVELPDSLKKHIDVHVTAESTDERPTPSPFRHFFADTSLGVLRFHSLSPVE